MLKKLTALLLSLLLSLSLLPGPALAADQPDPPAPPVIVEPLDPEKPGAPEPPASPQGDPVPDNEDSHHTS